MAIGLTIVLSVFAFLVLGGLAVYSVMVYNGLIRLRKNIDKAWSNIDVLLKQRNDEIPKLIDTVQEYMGYERDVLNEITEARSKVQAAQNPKESAEANKTMQGALGNLFAVAEDYPDLKSSQNFQDLQDRISDLENQIADRREFYNDSVNTYNIRINQIPYNMMANFLGYEEKELFEAAEEERQDLDISQQFNN